MLSEAYYTFFASKVPERFANMARAMGVNIDSLPASERPMSFVKALLQLQEACSVADLAMSDYAIQKEDIPFLAENARQTCGSLFSLDPYSLSLEETMEIMYNAYK